MADPNEEAWVEPRASWMVRAKFLFLAVYVLGVAVCYWIVFLGGPTDVSWDGASAWEIVGTSLFFFVPQILLLVGAPHWRWPRPRRRAAMWVSILTGSLIAAALSCGVFLALFSLLENVRGSNEAIREAFNLPGVMVAFVGLPWLLWLVIFGLTWAGEWLTLFRRMYRVLLARTCLELAITIPVDIQVRKRTNCYCGEGTFFSLIIGLTAIFWSFGPGVVFLFLARRMQRRRERGRCVKCDYDLRGSPGPRCPECGTVFEKAAAH